MPSALLVGGPRHMEFIDLPEEEQPVKVLSHSGTPIYAGENVSSLACDAHVYYRVFDVKKSHQFMIYEHATLLNSNIKRRADQLDRQRVAAAKTYKSVCDSEHFARHNKTLRDKELLASDASIEDFEYKLKQAKEDNHSIRRSRGAATFNATELHNKAVDAAAELNRINQERTKIAYNHGI